MNQGWDADPGNCIRNPGRVVRLVSGCGRVVSQHSVLSCTRGSAACWRQHLKNEDPVNLRRLRRRTQNMIRALACEVGFDYNGAVGTRTALPLRPANVGLANIRKTKMFPAMDSIRSDRWLVSSRWGWGNTDFAEALDIFCKQIFKLIQNFPLRTDLYVTGCFWRHKKVHVLSSDEKKE